MRSTTTTILIILYTFINIMRKVCMLGIVILFTALFYHRQALPKKKFNPPQNKRVIFSHFVYIYFHFSVFFFAFFKDKKFQAFGS